MQPSANAGRNRFLTAVGYNTITIDKQYKMLGIGFDGVVTEGMDINEVLPYQAGMTKGKGDTAADVVQVRTADGDYEVYYMSNGKYGKSGSAPETENHWVNVTNKEIVASRKFKPGDGFWYISFKTDEELSETPYTITVAGAVVNDVAKSPELINNAYAIIASPYPTDLRLNGDIVLTNPTWGKGDTVADVIQYRLDNGDYDVFYMSNGLYGKSGSAPATSNTWVDVKDKTVSTDKTIPAGKSFWFIRQSLDTQISIKSPLSR